MNNIRLVQTRFPYDQMSVWRDLWWSTGAETRHRGDHLALRPFLLGLGDGLPVFWGWCFWAFWAFFCPPCLGDLFRALGVMAFSREAGLRDLLRRGLGAFFCPSAFGAVSRVTFFLLFCGFCQRNTTRDQLQPHLSGRRAAVFKKGIWPQNCEPPKIVRNMDIELVRSTEESLPFCHCFAFKFFTVIWFVNIGITQTHSAQNTLVSMTVFDIPYILRESFTYYDNPL